MIDYLNPATLVLALLVALVTDLRSRKISNEIVLLVIILALLDETTVQSTSNIFDVALVRGILVFIVLIVPYLLNVIGGGDIKLLAALAFYNSLPQLLDFAWYASIAYIGTYFIFKLWYQKSPPQEEYRGMPLAVPIFFGQVATMLSAA